MSQSLRSFSWALTFAGLAIGATPAPHGWEGFFGYTAGFLIVYAQGMRRLGWWW